MTRNVAIVPHTHWDREWYAGFQSFRVRLVDILADLLDRLEADPGHRHFLLDGQMAVVDDYLAVRPEDEGRLRALAQAGRISVGPWYALMDEFLVSGETIVRNLQRGIARAAAFGGHLRVGYLPDMFGHVAQMPQLLRQAGMEDAVVWRGVPAAINRTGFWWRAPDGSTVRAEYLPAGYSNGASVPDDQDAVLRRLRAHEAQVAPFLGPTAPLLFMNGTDHQAPQAWLPKMVEAVNGDQKDFELTIMGLAEYLATAPREALPSWSGELRSGARANLLMGVASNRVDVKAAAAVAERTVERLAEPLAALWWPPHRWPGAVLDEAWLQMIRNSAHDSICACSADEVGLAVLHRYAEATSGAGEVVAAVARDLTGAFSSPGTYVVNPGAAARRGLVEVTLPGEGVPPGTQLVEATPAGTVEREVRGRDLSRVMAELSAGGWLDDGRASEVTVNWSPAGVDLNMVLDRSAYADRSLRPVAPAMAEAAAQAGANPDSPLWVRVERRPSVRVLALAGEVPGYGWSTLPAAGARAGLPSWPARPDDASTGLPAGVGAVRGGPNWLDNGIVHLAVNPADGTVSLNGLSGLDRLVDGGDDGDTYNYSPPDEDRLVERPDEVEVTPLEDGPVRGRLSVRRRFGWPARIEQGRRVGHEEVVVTTLLELVAGEPLARITTSFDNRARDHRLRAMFPLARRAEHSEAECAFAIVRRGLDAEGGPGERGLATYPSRRFVRAGGVTVTHEGLAEYEVLDDGWTLALTLLRATGHLSKPTASYRPNPAGPTLPLTGPQMVGPVTVRYAVAVGDVDPWRCVDLAWMPLMVVPAAGGGEWPETGSRLEVGGAEVSSLRRVSGALELRVFNPTDDATVVNVAGRAGWLVDLTGQPLARWRGSFPLGPWAIATARLDDEDAGEGEAG